MSTENRSSNTDLSHIEAASSAMTQIRTMLGREQRPDQVAAALEACDWSDTPIGNKAIILSAIRTLRAHHPHADPGEVERIRVELGYMREERDDLSAKLDRFYSRTHGIKNLAAIEELSDKLAERDALLADISRRHWSGVDFDLPADLVARIEALSARAEPSASTPQTINGHKLNCKTVDDYKPGDCSCGAEPDSKP